MIVFLRSDESLGQTNGVTLLGIRIDSSLSWKSYTDNVSIAIQVYSRRLSGILF